MEKNALLYLQTKDGITITDAKSAPVVITEATPNYKEIVEIIDAGNLQSLTIDDIKKKISVSDKLTYEKDGISFVFDEKSRDLKLFIDGDESKIPLSETFKRRIVETMKAYENLGGKFKMTMFANFIRKLSKNPSYKVIRSLYGFLACNDVPLTEDGNFRAYKKVDFDYKDLHSHTFDNSVGQTVKMPRNEVEDDPQKCCSHGLHVCSKSYLEHFGSNDPGVNRVVIVEVDPMNVVSIPADYNNAKMRVCEYKVVDELTDFDAQLGAYIVGKHRNGWLKELLPRIKKFYVDFWQLGGDKAFNWKAIDREEDDFTEVLAAKFVRDFRAAFGDVLDATVEIDDYAISEVAFSPLDSISLLSAFDMNQLVVDEE